MSNSFKILRTQLAQDLLSSDSPPFKKKIIFLPDLKMKNELLLAFLKHTNVVLGLDFMELRAGLQFLSKSLAQKELHLPPLNLLALHLLPFLEQSYSEKKAYLLAQALAIEFLHYGKFGSDELNEWKVREGWQQTLWHTVFSKWNTLADLCELSLRKPTQPLEIYLYKFSFLSELYHRFFQRVAVFCPVYYYQFSPCVQFWTDIFSERERVQLEKKVDIKVQSEWQLYLKDRPLLLAHFGLLARRTFRFFEEANFPLKEHYVSPEVSTLLKQIQHQILHHEEKQSLKQDDSICLLPTISRRREVEILYTTLLSLNCAPSDIRVYAPNIEVYAPFISLIFGGRDSPFPFLIFDLPKQRESSLMRAFMGLLSLHRERFEQKAVFRFFSCRAVREKFGLKEREVEMFASWMKKGGVKWGFDCNHRQMIFSGKEIVDLDKVGTWEDTFCAIFEGFTKLPKERPFWERPILDFSDAEVFGKCVSILRNVKDDLLFLEAASLPLNEWREYLHQLLHRYFQADENEHSTFKWIEEKIALLGLDLLPKDLYNFHALFEYLKNSFQEKTNTKQVSQLGTLCFSSLKLGAIDHSPVICLLGMDENQFPRTSFKSSICEIELKKQPLIQEEDRHLFLEALFAASSRLIMSYVSVNEEDGKEQAPSPVIQELLAFLDPISIFEIQPSFPFHADYFATPKYVSKSAFLAAKRFYSAAEKSIPFIPEFLSQTKLSTSNNKNIFIELRHLAQFARHPLRFYMNHSLRFYLEYEQKDEEFTLSALRQSLLRKRLYTLSFDEAFKEAGLHGKLPLGRFKEVAYYTTSKESENLLANLQKLHVMGEPDSLDFSFVFPLCDAREAVIEGTLLDVTSEGLLFHGEKKLSDLLQIWPLYLVYTYHEGEKDLLLTKSGERLNFPGLDCKESLLSYLLYYEKAQQVPSPFLPKWAEIFLEKGPEQLAKKIEDTKDPYILRVFQRGQYDVHAIFDTWAPILQSTFFPLREVLG